MQLQGWVSDLFMYQVRLRKMLDSAAVGIGGVEGVSRGLCVTCTSTP